MSDNRSILSTIFKHCLDVLRNNEHLTGDKALRNLAHLLDLRLLEKQFNSEIEIDNYNFDFSNYEDSIIEQHKAKLLYLVRFSNLAKQTEENIPHIMKCLWDEILSVHPTTKNIFLKGKGFDIQNQATYKKLIDKLNSFDFEAIDEDILGDAYEEVIKDVMVGKILGQFFTPPKIKHIMIKMLNPQIKKDGTIETIFDPALGTGGFLITSLRHLMKQSKDKKIKLDWNFIINKGLGGREAEPDTFQLAVSNMLISSGHMFNLEKGDSIRDPITKKYDIVLANPPFGIHGLVYNDIQHELKNEYIPIKSNSAVPLFLQAIIYMLNINGRCAVVLPNGKELFGKTKELIVLREFLTKTCDLKEIISLPSGIFTNTSINTCIFYFEKKKEGIDVLTTKIKVSKSHKETGRSYNFVKEHQTNIVKFYEYNVNDDTKTLLVEVPIDKIVNNSYSLNYNEYIEKSKVEIDNSFIIKTLGEVCTFQNGKSIKKLSLQEGEYPVIGGGQKPMGFHNKYNTNENTILCSSSGAYAGYISKYNVKVWASDCFTINPKEELNNEYLYYVLKQKQQEIYERQSGMAQPHIYSKTIIDIKIPIPSLQRQKQIVEHLDYIYDKVIKSSEEKIDQLNAINILCINHHKENKNNVIKTIADVCNVSQGTYITKDMKIDGEYPVYGGGDISFYINKYNREDEIIVAKDGISHNCVRYEKNKFFLNHHAWTLLCKDNIIKKYLFYYLQSIQDNIYNISSGTAQKGINQENFYSLEVSLPPIDIQNKIVEYCDANCKLIEELQKEIERNKLLAKSIIINL